MLTPRLSALATLDTSLHGYARPARIDAEIGSINWDISVFKNVPLGGSRRLQLRVELYNAFNTDQWTGVNTNATFDYITGALTNANTFSRLNGNTNSARRIQLGARFTF